VYARAYLEGRLSEEQLNHYRQETGGKGLSSYCHPYLMPDFWQFPTGSMGLGPLNAIYQARFMRYLEHRNLLVTAKRKVWAFVGDGEMDEPESLAALSLAARDGLDNLIFVVNCNLQRLDGPVRGNGSIVQELEGLFAGAGWNVLKLLWGSDWDPLFARDDDGVLLKRLHETVDGEFQTYAATDGRFNREHFFNKYPEVRQIIADMSDEDIDRLKRGGHDPLKIYAAYHVAARHEGQPTVILAQTKKGYGMGTWGQGKMGTHQQKKLDDEALRSFRDRFSLPLSDEDVAQLRFYNPGPASPEIRYLLERRKKLGGFLPVRKMKAEAIAVPALAASARNQSTTMAFVQLLAALLKDEKLGRRVVPIVADEARTFGMQTLFRQFGIYSALGQLYEPEDHDELLYYREAKDGQILEEGITEAGALSSWLAAATAYSSHGTPMLPFYIYYSVFGFQRVGDLIWAAGDSRARGFLVGGTAGRTTLAGEGLQHQDGSSHLVAATVPNCRAYDPCFAQELALIIQDGAKRMLEAQEDVFYYVTVTNENYDHPGIPSDEGVLKGMYLYRKNDKASLQLLGSGPILREVIAAAELLEKDWKIAANVWSVTSFTELRRDGMRAERARRLGGKEESWVGKCLKGHKGPALAASDYVSAVADLIRPYVPGKYVALGTDGFGRSDTRAALRDFFEVDAKHIAVAALAALESPLAAEALQRYGIVAEQRPSWER
jgi:pyruvate dehydrogenase E1 component